VGNEQFAADERLGDRPAPRVDEKKMGGFLFSSVARGRARLAGADAGFPQAAIREMEGSIEQPCGHSLYCKMSDM
jgi:hypothetical protein